LNEKFITFEGESYRSMKWKKLNKGAEEVRLFPPHLFEHKISRFNFLESGDIGTEKEKAGNLCPPFLH